jgi:polyisoprenoid-binding protein YceI
MSTQQRTEPMAGSAGSGAAAAMATVRPGCWTVEPVASTATFRAVDFTRRTVVGTIPVVEGRVVVDDDGCPVGVSAVLDATGIETGIARRDRDLRSRHFFDVEAFPTITFAAEVVRAGAAGWEVEGRLLVRDVPCPVVLDVRPEPALRAGAGCGTATSDGEVATSDGEVSASGGTRAIDAAPVVVVATTTLDRRDAGLRAAPGFVIGHRVAVEVRATLQPPQD